MDISIVDYIFFKSADVYYRYGIFWFGNEPAIFLRDLDLIKKVQVTDFEYFYNFGKKIYYYQYLSLYIIRSKNCFFVKKVFKSLLMTFLGNH